MNAHDYAKQIKEVKQNIKQVYWVACGGSVIDLYPAHCLLTAESPQIESGIYTAAEFNMMTPAALGSDSVVITCSHSGGTMETIEAKELAKSRGAFVLAMTNNSGSKIDTGKWPCWVYEWKDNTPQSERPAGFSLTLAEDLLVAEGGKDKRNAFAEGIVRLDDIISTAKPAIESKLGRRFVDLCHEHDFLYILGSGPTFCQTYGFAICSLMEMQWQNCSYINSCEYFHGPFECTESGVFYFLQMSSGVTRPADERAFRFLKDHTDALMVLDSAEYGMLDIDESVRSYLDPIFFYEMNVSLRGIRGKAFNHDPEMRRYMGVVEY